MKAFLSVYSSFGQVLFISLCSAILEHEPLLDNFLKL